MRILIVSQYYYPERVSVSEVAEQLVKHGHQVEVLTAKPNYGFQKILPDYKKVSYQELNEVAIHRVNVYPRKYSRLSVIRNYLSFHRNAKRRASKFKRGFDLVLAISLSPVISIAPAIKYAKKFKVPCVLYCWDLWPESVLVTNAVKKNSLMYKLLYKWSVSLYSKCDKIIVSSPSFKEYFNDVLKISNKGFPTVYQPTILSTKSATPVVYKHKHNIVYAGNIGHIQLTNELVEAMKYVKSEDTKLYLMGMGSELEAVQRKIKEEKLEDKVEYVGALPIEKAEAYYFNADALVVSLKYAGTVGKTIPNKAIQYMKYGCPLIGVIKGDARDLLSKANGTIFSEEDPKEIANKIDELISLSEKEKTQMGLNNKNYFEDNLTCRKLVDQLDRELMAVKK